MQTNPSTGRLVGRLIKTLMLGGGEAETAEAIAQSSNWSDRGHVVDGVKAAVGATGTGDIAPLEAGRDLRASVEKFSVAGQLQLAARAPLNVRTIFFGTATQGYVVGQGAPKPLTALSVAGAMLEPRKGAAMTVVTNETLRFSTPATETAIGSELGRAAAAALDVAMVSPAIAGSILNGAATVTSSGSGLSQVDGDLRALLAALTTAGSNLAAAAFLMGPVTAAYLAFLRGSGGERAFPDLGITGGSIAGVQVIVSPSAAGLIAAVDQNGIVIASDGAIGIKLSKSASVQMLDNPTNNSDTPTPTSLISMFQTNSAAVLAEMWSGWLARAGSTVYMTVSF